MIFCIYTTTIGVGPDLTKLFADAHETETPVQLQLESQMDLFNNAVGIAIGQDIGFWTSLDDLAGGVHDKVIYGELRYLYPINYKDVNFYSNGNPSLATHGITSSTVLTPTNR